MIGNRTSLIRRIALSLWTFERGLDRSNEATDLNELDRENMQAIQTMCPNITTLEFRLCDRHLGSHSLMALSGPPESKLQLQTLASELESMSIPGKIVLDIRVYVDEEDQDMEEAQISDEARMIGNGNHRRSEIDEMEKTALSYGWAVEVQRVKRRTWSTSDGQWILYTQEDADGYEEELLDEIWEREQEREQVFSSVILGRGLRMRRK
ncbi:hypothetical protein PG988_010957 [Apiospora saccharicola]